MRWDERIGRRLKLRDLHTLEVTAQFGSMAKASRELGLSQPAISKAIGEMELLLGVKLLERSAQGVELTASGVALVDRTRAVFDEVRQGVIEIERLSDPYSGEVRVGATEPLAVTVAEIINLISSKHPMITSSTSAGSSFARSTAWRTA
jgi:DNA-binding transcriptional LysR family regulator